MRHPRIFLAVLASAWFHPGFAAAATLYTSACATTGDGAPSVADVQSEINEALGTKTAVNDFNNDTTVNVVDIQTVIDAVLGLGCVATPVITDFNPKTGSIGTVVTVTGRYLVATQISMPQQGGGVANQLPLTTSAAGVSFAVPITAATGPITIATASGSATTAGSFAVTSITVNQTVLAGRALIAGGSPVAGAVVTTQDGLSTFTTNDGRFLIPGESASTSVLLVTAKGTANGVPLGASILVSPQAGAVTNVGDIQLLACAPPPTGLVSWWTGDGHLEDIVSGNNGTVQITNPGYAPGLIGQAFSFDGLTQFFSVPDSSTLDAIDTAISAAAWINPKDTTTTGVMLSRRTSGNAEVFTIYLNYPGSGAVDVRVTDTVHGTWDFSSLPGVLQAGQWQHVAATVNTSTGTVKLYLNGLPVSLTNPGTLTGQLPAANSLFIGALQASDYNYKGLMEELELYGVEVSQTQVLAMISAPAGTCSAPFTTTATGRVVDQTGSGVASAAVSTLGPAGTVRSATSASDGTFSIPGVIAVSSITAGASATVSGVPLFGASASVAPVPGGTTSLGNMVLTACSNPVTGLVSWWTGDGYLDDVVSGNNGTVQITNPTFVTGKVGEAFSFNGANQFFGVPDSTTLDGITSAITVSGWIDPQSASSYEVLFSRNTSGGAETLTIYLNLPNAGSVDVRVTDTSHGTQDFYSSPVIQFGQWQHLAATANTSTGSVKLYINGQQIGLTTPVTLSGQLHAANRLFIGAFQPGYYNYNGLIDELQLYDAELSQLQIQTIMAEPAGSCSAPFTTVVTGRVVNQGGTGVAGVVVTTFGPAGAVQSATTASDGTFSISGVLAVMGPVSVGATGTVSGVSMFGTSGGVSPVEGGTVSVGSVVLAPCVTPAPGLVSWWTGDGNLYDIVSGNNGVLQITSPSFVAGQVGQAFSFDGVSDYIGITDSASLDGITTAISVSGWINPQTVSSYEVIFSRRTSGGGELMSVYLNLPNQGSVDVRVTDTVHGQQDFYSSPGLIQFGQWQHVAATANLSTGTVQLYWNGQQVGLTIPVTLSGQFPAAGKLYIGALQPSYYAYAGLIDDMQLYSVELTQTQVQDLYFAPRAGVCRTGFETGVTGLVQDASSKSVAGARAAAAGGMFSLTASDGTFTIPNVLTIFSPIRVDAAAVINGTPVFGNSANVTAVAAGATNVGGITLSQCSPGGLVSLWPGEGNANDIVGGNNGTFHSPAYAPGLAGQAFSFNGSTAYIGVPDSASLDAITSAITVAGWVNPQSGAGYEVVFSRNVTGPGAFTVYFNVYGTGSVAVDVTDSVHGTERFYSSAGVVQFGQWQYLAVTASTVTGLVKLYLNGQQVGLTAPAVLSGQFPVAQSLYLGGAQAADYLYLGLIDELQLYNAELSLAQIQNIYAQGGAGMCRN